MTFALLALKAKGRAAAASGAQGRGAAPATAARGGREEGQHHRRANRTFSCLFLMTGWRPWAWRRRGFFAALHGQNLLTPAGAIQTQGPAAGLFMVRPVRSAAALNKKTPCVLARGRLKTTKRPRSRTAYSQFILSGRLSAPFPFHRTSCPGTPKPLPFPAQYTIICIITCREEAYYENSHCRGRQSRSGS